jgi:hypothetical protein
MKKFPLLSVLILLSVVTGRAGFDDIFIDQAFFHATDSLAQRDQWGLLHQGRSVNDTDFAQRYRCRWEYYFKASEQLVVQPAYVGALQRDLTRLGYYCGPIDGVFSDDVRVAIARLQKDYSMRVTGRLTEPVRRVLHLP